MSAHTNSPTDKPLGNIITFYSYKGGTGRSMTVANVAWVLASGGKRVLTVDWDLEAPGLHRYFSPFLADNDLTGSDGLIDLLIEFRDATATGPSSAEGEGNGSWHERYADITAYVVSLDWEFPRSGTLDLLPAGRQGASYSARVNSFDWEEFYERRGGGVFLEAVKEKMRLDYDYVLIDSRTGVSDTSGICTVQMPDAVVVCFTLNNQGIKGSAAVAHSIYEQRLRKGKEIAIFPAPMRVEPFEKTKLDMRREYAKKMFELFPAHLPPQSRAQFQEDVQVKYLPYYAYEEILAIFGNRYGESEGTSLLAPAERLTGYLTDFLPGEPINHLEASEYLESRRQSVLALFEGKEAIVDPTQLLIKAADAAWAGLSPEDEKTGQRALLRLVRVADAREQSGDTRLLVKLSDFDLAAQTILRQLANTPLITIDRDTSSGEAAVQISGDDLLRNWPRLQSWVQENRDFLIWRQKLNSIIAEWKRLNGDKGALLVGAPLEQAKNWQSSRAGDLNENELAYINRSVHENEKRIHEQLEREEREKQQAAERMELEQQTEVLRKTSEKSQHRSRIGVTIVSSVMLLVLAGIVWWVFRQQDVQTKQLKAANLTTDANVEGGKKNYDKVIEKASEAIKVDPSYAPAYHSRGRGYLENRQFDQALADFDTAISLNANYAEAYLGRGNVYSAKHDYPSALAAYNRAIEINPKLSDAYINRGKVFAAQNNLDKALADYNKAIEVSSDDPYAYLGRGNIYSMSGDYDRAFDDFSKALSLRPDLLEVYIKRGNAFLSRGRPGDSERAITEYTQALNSNVPPGSAVPYDPMVYLNRGIAYENIQKIESATADYQKALNLSVGKPEYSKIREDASHRLQKKQIRPADGGELPEPQSRPEIYLQYRDAKDLPTLNKISAALLKNSNYKVGRRPELVTQLTDGDVRYFHQEDQGNATTVKQIVEKVLKDNRIEKTLDLRPLLKLGDRVPQGWIEVWLPTLPEPPSAKRPAIEINPMQSRPRPQQQQYRPNSRN